MPSIYSDSPAVECQVYQHVNGKQYHSAKRQSPTFTIVRGDEVAGKIALFAINPKTGRAWQAARYFNPADVKPVGSLVV